MADVSVTFRTPHADLYKAAAGLAGVSVSDWLRDMAAKALSASGFAVPDPGIEYTAVINGEVVYGLREDLAQAAVMLPIVNIDSAPFDPAKHWRLKPLPLRVEGDRVVREFPIVMKSLENM